MSKLRTLMNKKGTEITVGDSLVITGLCMAGCAVLAGMWWLGIELHYKIEEHHARRERRAEEE